MKKEVEEEKNNKKENGMQNYRMEFIQFPPTTGSCRTV